MERLIAYGTRVDFAYVFFILVLLLQIICFYALRKRLRKSDSDAEHKHGQDKLDR